MIYPLSFLLLLTPLVFVHELGHFLFARLFGVRVDVFSIGFGPKIFRRKRGDTEYCVSAIPLGGYVKILGQDPAEQVDPADRHRSFMSKEPWKRFFILLGGPLFNFLFAVMVFALILVMGEPHLGTRIGRVIPGSQADVAGFRAGDLITAVDDRMVTKLEDVIDLVSAAPNKELLIRVRRKNDIRDIRVVPQPQDGLSVYGEAIKVGEIEGLETYGRMAVIAVPEAGSVAAKAGLKTGDLILSVNDAPVATFEDLEEKIRQAAASRGASELRLTVEPHDFQSWASISRDGGAPLSAPKTTPRTVTLPAKRLKDLGIQSSELVVAGLLSGSPAEAMGIKAGDYIVSANGRSLNAFEALRVAVQKSGDEKTPVSLRLLRDGKPVNVEITPTVHEVKEPISGRVNRSYAVGIYPLLVASEPEMVTERIFNPFHLTVGAWTRALDLSGKTLVSIKKLFLREVSMGTLGGPLLIGKLAGDSLQRGLISFLRAMALISISLAVFNILPIPLLDGGHIVILGIEKLRGRPLGPKQTELVQQVGLSIIMLLLVVVLFNDFTRVAVPAFQNVFR